MKLQPAEIILCGLDGANPLAFLAALGVLRAASDSGLERPRLSWRSQGAWRPVLHLPAAVSADDLIAQLHRQLAAAARNPALDIGDDLAIGPAVWRAAAQAAVVARDMLAADFLAAFGCDALVDEKGLIRSTALCMMSGAGHQHFLKGMRDILSSVQPNHLHKALFAPWRYDDPLQRLSLRLDPLDDRRYALRRDDPKEARTRERGNMLGANSLAALGMSLLPALPVAGTLETTGFRGQRRNDRRWTWPIWGVPLALDSIRSVLALPELQMDTPSREKLAGLGIVEVLRSRRIAVDRYLNFTPAHPV
ncbi:MAG: hypothetical protein AB1716_03265 [Planctomycetota bacterium]